MSYYRAALAAANSGDYSAAARFVRCSLALGEDAPSAARLLNLLQQNERRDGHANLLGRLRTPVDAGKYKKALRIRLPSTTETHTIRGLLYAIIGRRRAAREEFAVALTLDSGNHLAKQALTACREEKKRNRK